MRNMVFIALVLVIINLLSACSSPLSSPVAAPKVGLKANVESDIEGSMEGNVEELRVRTALHSMGTAMEKSPFSASSLHAAIAEAKSNAQRIEAARRVGQALWVTTQKHMRENTTFDDRPLYWNRLAVKQNFRQHCAEFKQCEKILDTFEYASRGVDNLKFTKSADIKILISGFDPFYLDRNIQQSNPSGVAAIFLDNQLIHSAGRSAEVQSVVVPVRFADFDEGRIEKLFQPFITEDKIDFLITISMGRDDFDLERFPGRRRSAQAPGNLNVLTGASANNPLIPMLGEIELPGPEFVEFSLPVDAMLKIQSPFAVHDNHRVSTLERGAFTAESLAELSNQTAVRGGGGGYLSNEISFRTVRLVRLHNKKIGVGHIHTPKITGYDRLQLKEIIGQLRYLLEATIAD